MSWSPSDRYLATASFDSTVAICRVEVTDGVIDLLSIAILEGRFTWCQLEHLCAFIDPSSRVNTLCGSDEFFGVTHPDSSCKEAHFGLFIWHSDYLAGLKSAGYKLMIGEGTVSVTYFISLLTEQLWPTLSFGKMFI